MRWRVGRLSTFSLVYHFTADITMQTAVAYNIISTIINLILFIAMIVYHVLVLIRKAKSPEEEDGYHFDTKSSSTDYNSSNTHNC